MSPAEQDAIRQDAEQHIQTLRDRLEQLQPDATEPEALSELHWIAGAIKQAEQAIKEPA